MRFGRFVRAGATPVMPNRATERHGERAGRGRGGHLRVPPAAYPGRQAAHCRIIPVKNGRLFNSRDQFEMAKRGSIQKIADETGVNQATVRRALADAGVGAGHGDDRFVEAVEIVKAYVDQARVIGHAAHGRGDGGNTETTSALTAAKLRSEQLRARKIEIENAEKEGSLIPREAVTETGSHIIATARTALLSLGHRLAAKVAGKSDLVEIARIVEAEIRDVLSVLADESKFFAALEADALS